MNVSNLISKFCNCTDLDFDTVCQAVAAAYPEMNWSAQQTIVSGLYHIHDSKRWPTPDVFRFQLENILGECHNFLEWFDLDPTQKLKFFVLLEKFLMETDLTGVELGDEVSYQLYLFKESTMDNTVDTKKCHACDHPIEDIRLGDLCARCTQEAFEEEACNHCGERGVDLDSDNLCEICSYEQWRYDNGKCPVCETPSPGSRACSGC